MTSPKDSRKRTFDEMFDEMFDLNSGPFIVSGRIIAVTVGQGVEAKTFLVHMDTLTQSSSFFRAALRNDWEERLKHKIHLPEDDPAVFQYYVDYLYSHKLNATKPKTSSDAFTLIDELVRTLVLGDKLQDDEFSNLITKSIIIISSTTLPAHVEESTKIQLRIPAQSIARIWKDLPAGCPLRRYAIAERVHYHSKRGTTSIFELDYMPKDFYIDLARALVESIQTGSPECHKPSDIEKYLQNAKSLKTIA